MSQERLFTPAFAFVCLSTLGAFLGIGMLLPVIPVYADGPLGAGTVGVGLLVAASTPAAALLQPLAGRLADRRGRRILLVSGPLCYGLFLALFTVADSYGPLLAIRIISGIAEAGVFVGTATVVNDLAPEHRRGEAVSLYSLATWGGLAAGPVLGEAILGQDRFDAVWLGAAGCLVLSAVFGALVRETRPETPAPEGKLTLISRPAVLPGLALIALMIGFAGMFAFTPLYARTLGMEGAGLVFAVNAGVILLVRGLGRKLPDRLGPRRAATAAVIFAAAGLTLIAAIRSPAGLYAGAVVLALGQSLAFPALLMLTVAAAAPSERSAAIGSFSAGAEVGYAIGAISLGGVAAALGYPAVYGVAAGLVSLGLLPLARVPQARRVPVPATADAPP